MSLFQVDFEGVPPASQLGYVLYARGTALGPRTGAGILPADWPDGVTAGLQGGDYSVLIDTVATGADTLVWDTGGSSPQSASVSLVAPPLPVLATIAIPVTYTPNPVTAAQVITQNGVDYGPFPCAVTGPAADGITYTLTASLTSIPAGLTPGPVSVQVGDIVDGVFVPAVIAGVAVPPDTGTLSMSGSSAPVLDIGWTAGPVQTNVSDTDSCFLAFGADGYIHVKLTGTYNADGSGADLAALIAGGTPLSMALWTDGNAPASAYQPADVLTATAPATVAGTYAKLLVSASGENLPAAGYYFVAAQIGTTIVWAQTVLIVSGEMQTSVSPALLMTAGPNAPVGISGGNV